MADTNKSTTDVLQELRDLLVAYAKQETVDPLKALGRYLAMGVAGAIFVGLGVYLLSLGTMRGLQHFAWTEGGFLSVIPYLGAVLVLVIVILLSAFAINRASRQRAREKAKGGRP